MKRSTSSAMMTTAISVAAVAGTAAYMLAGNGGDMRRRTKKIRKSTGRALRQVGGYIENISQMMQ